MPQGVTSVSGSRRRPPRAAGASPRPARVRRPPGRVAWFLLVMALLSTGSLAQCLWPPDYELAPDVNLPVTIDPTLLEVAPDFRVWPGCPTTFDLDIGPALVNPDDDELFVVWIVNYQAGLRQTVDALDTLEFSFDPCTHQKAVTGSLPNRIEVLVFDRKPVSLNNADDARTPATDDTTSATATWFLLVDDDTCCFSQNP